MDAIHVLPTLIGTVDTTVNKNDKKLCLHVVYIMVQVIHNKINNEAPWYVGNDKFCSVQLLSRLWLLVTPWTAILQASHPSPFPGANSNSMLSKHLILCHPILLPASIFPSIRVFYNESVLHIRWPKFWSFSLSISLSNEYSGLISFRMDWFDLHAIQDTLKSLLQHHR